MSQASPSHAAVALDDKYRAPTGHHFLSGMQVLVRALLNQAQRDAARGWRTGGFVSGYRGSPLGGLDKELWKNKALLEPARVVFRPGVNEELAAGACAGTQQLGLLPGAQVEGVFSLWYAKGPGVDRAGDVFRHANLTGSAPRGGVVVLCGDDHGGVSTTTNHQSDPVLRAWQMPMLLPANLQDVLDLCTHAWEASRCTGLYIGLKALADTVETTGVVDVDAQRVQAVLPEVLQDAQPLGIRAVDDRWQQEERLLRHRLPLFQEYVRLNRLNRVTARSDRDRLGIAASGKAYEDVLQALADLGVTERHLVSLGIRLMKVTAPWPLHPADMQAFCEGLEDVAVVEEKSPIVEEQLRAMFHDAPSDARPRIVGKLHAGAQPAPLSAASDLDAAQVARFLASWLDAYAEIPALGKHVDFLDAKARQVDQAHGTAVRQPYFCSGCPHNTSTRLPDGSMALAGVGCHYMALSVYPEHTRTFSVMGTEGANWIGMAPFTDTPHSFVNVGEGTYFHSAILAVRASVAAGVNVTYKLLFNDAVAMTGGQPVDGPLTVGMLVAQLRAEGVRHVAVVAQELDAGRADLGLPNDLPIHDRTELDAVQRELRAMPGCTALVYVQTCAAEKRRRRKRGGFPDPQRRLVINEEVCEGCGDCGEASNCVSLVPLETPLGRKRAIDQSACNKDYSCANGFCPSFVSVRGAALKKEKSASAWRAELDALPPPRKAPLHMPYNLLVTGIGGTGVITVGALLGMAAHLDGLAVSVLDMTGMAQKNGGVQSHIRIARRACELHGARIPWGAADVLLAADMVEATSRPVLASTRRGRTRLLASTARVMPGRFAREPDLALEAGELQALLLRHVGEDDARFVDAAAEAARQLGDAIGANLLMLGYALQCGWLPVSLPALEQAVRLNGVAVQANLDALALGRLLAARPAATPGQVLVPLQAIAFAARTAQVDEVVADRLRRLADYGAPHLAARYTHLVDAVRAAEQRLGGSSLPLTLAVARNFHKLLAIKDEYEVARQLTTPAFRDKLAAMFEPGFRVSYHLAPPLLARRGPDGKPRKREYGRWMLQAMRALAALRGLRGTPLDPFGYTAERKMERALADDYEALMLRLLPRLTTGNRALLASLAGLPERIRGYGHVKQAGVEKALAARQQLLDQLDAMAAADANRPPGAGTSTDSSLPSLNLTMRSAIEK